MRLALLIGAVLLILVASLQGGDDAESWFVIKKVSVEGELKYSQSAELEQEFSDLLGRSLLDVEIADVLALAKSSPWVENAQVRKVWPDSLTVTVVEHTPLAYWQDRQLISTKAVVFMPHSLPELPLPHLFGPSDSSDIVLEQFGLISQMLSASSLRIASLTLEARGAWNVVFANGIAVKLGREEILERLQRFIAVYKSDLSGRIEGITSVDARYPHGVAVGWKENN